MIGKLGVSFGGNALASRCRIMRKPHIFLMELLRIAAQFHIRPIRFIGCIPVRHMIMVIIITVTATTATTTALSVLRLSHKVWYHMVD
jgi:hypothetical protein